jgi:hypothetical protein
MWDALSEESNKSVFSMYNLHFTCYYRYMQYVQGLCLSRISTADRAIRIKCYNILTKLQISRL